MPTNMIVIQQQIILINYQTYCRSMSQLYNPADEISIKQIPKFEFQIKNEQLINCMKELTLNFKQQQKNIQKVKKDLEIRPSQSQIAQAFVFTNTLIQIQPSLIKQLKSKQNKKEQLANNPINNSASQLGKKINMLSQALSLLHNQIKTVDKRLTDFQFSSKSSLTQKTNNLQEQIDENHTKAHSQFLQIKQKIELNMASFNDKVRQVQTKTLWQINDCKMRLNSCINQQYVKDSLKQLDGKIQTKMKQELIRQGSIDPDRIVKIQQQIMKNQKSFASQMTEVNFKIQNLKQHTQKQLLSKKQYGDERIQLQKRFGLLNNNFADAVRRIRSTQSDILEEKERVKKLENFEQSSFKQMNRMNQVLKNLKIGDDFQKMLEKMDPHKICQLDERVNDITLNQQKLNKLFQLTKLEVDRLRSKTQFCNILSPSTNNSTGSKMSKQQIQAIIHQYFTNNLFAKKLQTLEAQFIQIKAFPDMVNDVNKKLARLQKQTDTHSLSYELKGLQQYVKKQILIVNNRINGLQSMINQDKKKRPMSAGKTTLGSDQKLGSSVSYKKLTPVNCISCYPNSSSGPIFDKSKYMRKI